MSRKLLWKFLLIIATGTVALFYFINYFASQAEADMSLIDQTYRDEIKAWGAEAETLFYADDKQVLHAWVKQLEEQESTTVSIVEYQYQRVAGNLSNKDYYVEYSFGRNVDWPIHLDFKHTPLMEVPFKNGQVSFLVLLPERMKPGNYLSTIRLVLQVVLPLIVMTLLAVFLYRHIMQPLSKLQFATRDFSKGDYSVRVRERMGGRNDELTELANTFDKMASHIGNQIINQRQFIADLSHELRTPLARLDIAIDSAKENVDIERNLERVDRESKNIRRLVEDSLALAWLDNEKPQLGRENLDLVDLMDVIIEDAKFEFPQCRIQTELPESAPIKQSNHLAIGQAVENILRNALRYTPEGGLVEVCLKQAQQSYLIEIKDSGPGVPDAFLETIFQPFFRVDKSRQANGNSFGLGLSLARRQLHAVGGEVSANNRKLGGLAMTIQLPIDQKVTDM